MTVSLLLLLVVATGQLSQERRISPSARPSKGGVLRGLLQSSVCAICHLLPQ
jgi:hypothetical protein